MTTTVRTHLHAPTQYTDPTAQQSGTITAAFKLRPDSIDWTELQTHASLAAVESAPGFDTFWGGGLDDDGRPRLHPKNYVAISWRTDRYRFISGDTIKATDGLSGVQPDRYFPRVVLEDMETGERVARVGGHFPAGLDSNKAPRAYRVASHAECTDKFRNRMREGLPTIGGCDSNVTDFPARLGDQFTYATTAGTHGPRRIDYVVGYLSGKFTARAVRLGFSDHRGVFATHQFAPKETPVTYRYLTELADVLRAAGLKVVEVDGWKTRGRPASTGGYDPVGVLCHHTATGENVSDADVVRLLVNGRSDLPGPLAPLGLARDGTYYVIAAGRCNHAGRAKASGTVAAGDGNELYGGIEAFNDGVGEPWPEVQMDAYVIGAAAISEHITKGSAQTVRGHKETSVTGKIDPTFDMDDFRTKVAAAMVEPSPPAPPRTKNITAFLAAKTIAAKTREAKDIVEHGRPDAVRAAKAWLAAEKQRAASVKAKQAATKALKKEEVR